MTSAPIGKALTLRMGTNQHRVGAAAEQLIAAHLIGKGHDVFFPAMTQSRVDLIYTKGSESRRAQVKVGTRFKARDKEYENVKLMSAGKNRVGTRPYAEDEIDELWVLGTHLWCIPARLIVNRKMLSLTSKDPSLWKRADYDCDQFIVQRGDWDNPVRSVLGLGG